MAQDWIDDCYKYDQGTASDTLDAFEDNFAALKSCFSGANSPANPVPAMWWYDTANDLIKQRNADNNGWITWFDLGNEQIGADLVDSSDIEDAARKASIITGEDIAPGSCSIKNSFDVGAGDYVEASADTERTVSGLPYVKKKGVRVGRAGQYRLKFDVKVSGGSTFPAVYWQTYLDGVLLSGILYCWYSTSLSYTTISIGPVEVPVNGLIEIYLASSSGTTGYIKDFKLCSDNPITTIITLD